MDCSLGLAIEQVDGSVTKLPIVVLHIYGQMAPRFPETQCKRQVSNSSFRASLFPAQHCHCGYGRRLCRLSRGLLGNTACTPTSSGRLNEYKSRLLTRVETARVVCMLLSDRYVHALMRSTLIKFTRFSA